MSVTNFFKRLGVPLKNSRWSWGAVREDDGAVFLRVWQDRKFIEDKTMFMMLTHHEKYEGDEQNLGYQERLTHVRLVEEGADCYMIMCLADDVEASPRKIKSFNSRELFVGGEILERNGETWVRVVKRVPVTDRLS